MASMRPLWSCRTCWAVVVEGLPERLAEGAATGDAGQANDLSGDLRFGAANGHGGQAAGGPFWDAGIGRQDHGEWSRPKSLRQEVRPPPGYGGRTGGICSGPVTCKISGLSPGRPLASKILATASGFSPSAPRP